MEEGRDQAIAARWKFSLRSYHLLPLSLFDGDSLEKEKHDLKKCMGLKEHLWSHESISPSLERSTLVIEHTVICLMYSKCNPLQIKTKLLLSFLKYIWNRGKHALKRHRFCMQYWQVGVGGRLLWEGTFGAYHNHCHSVGRYIPFIGRGDSSECYRLVKHSLQLCNFLCCFVLYSLTALKVYLVFSSSFSQWEEKPSMSSIFLIEKFINKLVFL